MLFLYLSRCRIQNAANVFLVDQELAHFCTVVPVLVVDGFLFCLKTGILFLDLLHFGKFADLQTVENLFRFLVGCDLLFMLLPELRRPVRLFI